MTKEQRLKFELDLIYKDLIDHFEAIAAGRVPFAPHSAVLLRRLKSILAETTAD